MPGGGPDLEFRVAAGPYLQQRVVAAIVQVDGFDRLLVAAVEPLGEPKDRGERPDRAATPAAEIAKQFVALLRYRLPVVPRDERDGVDFLRVEPSQIAILDEIARVLVVPLVADMHADVVEQCRVLEPLAFAIGQAVHGAGLIEERDGQPGDLLRVLRPVVAAFGQLDDAAASHVRIPLRLRDLLAVARDVVEHETFTQRQIAERDRRRAQTSKNRVEHHRARDREVGAARLEAWHAQPVLEIEVEQVFPEAVDLLGRDAAVAKRRVRRAPFRDTDDRAQAEDRAGCADHVIESRRADFIEIPSDLRLDVADKLPLVARGKRIAVDEPFGQTDDAELEALRELDVRSDTPRQLNASPADIDDDGRVGGDVDPVNRCAMDEARLFGAGDHPWADSSLTDNFLEEFAAVFRLSGRACRGGDDFVDLVRLGEPSEF